MNINDQGVRRSLINKCRLKAICTYGHLYQITYKKLKYCKFQVHLYALRNLSSNVNTAMFKCLHLKIFCRMYSMIKLHANKHYKT